MWISEYLAHSKPRRLLLPRLFQRPGVFHAFMRKYHGAVPAFRSFSPITTSSLYSSHCPPSINDDMISSTNWCMCARFHLALMHVCQDYLASLAPYVSQVKHQFQQNRGGNILFSNEEWPRDAFQSGQGRLYFVPTGQILTHVCEVVFSKRHVESYYSAKTYSYLQILLVLYY